MPDEVAPGIFQLALPLGDNPLGTVNAYAVTSQDDIRLVDCGWNTPEAYTALASGLAAIGASVASIREIVVTHLHPDHFGLAQRLTEESGARLLMHRMDAVYVSARYEDTRRLVAEMEAWLRINGVPSDQLEHVAEASLKMLERVGARQPDVLLEGGETLAWGSYEFEVIWTPGHSAGLICLYDREAQVFISDDHVLERTSPHVGLHAQSLGNPLGDYLDSLRLVRDLPVRAVLPGHGAPFSDLASRVDAILEHHQQRFAEVLMALDDGEQTAYSVAGHLSWRGSRRGWQDLEAFQRRLALTETIAHLEFMHTRGQVGKWFQSGIAKYNRTLAGLTIHEPL